MRVKTITVFSLIVFFNLLICYSAFSASIFTVVGTVRDADDTLIATGLEVVVSNETKKLTATTTLGKQESGRYGAVFIDMENKTVAAEGDVLKVTVKDGKQILASLTSKLTADDIAKSLAIVDVKLGTSILPLGGLTVLVVPNILPADGKSTATITATIKDSKGNPVVDEPLTMVVSQGTGRLSKVRNNKDGTYTAVYIASHTIGTEIIRISAPKSHVDKSIEIQLTEPNVFVFVRSPKGLEIQSIEPSTIHVGDKITINGKKFYSIIYPIASATVVFSDKDGKFLGETILTQDQIEQIQRTKIENITVPDLTGINTGDKIYIYLKLDVYKRGEEEKTYHLESYEYPVTWGNDTTPFVITAVSPQGTIHTPDVTLSVTATDESDIASIIIKLDGIELTNVKLIGGVATAEVTNLQYGEHKVEAVVIDNAANTASKEWSFVVAEPTALTEMKVGALTIKAKDIHQKSGSLWIASGDVSINDFLLFEKNLEIDSASSETYGSGTIYLKHVPYLGDKIPLFTAESFSFNGDVANLAEQAGLKTNLTIGFLAYSLDTLKLIPDGVEIGGSIALPEGTYAMIGGKPSGMVQADLSITKTKGLELLTGNIEISNLRLGSTGFTLENLYLEYRKEDNYFEGRGAVYIPHYFSIEAAVGVKQGQLNKVGIGVDKLNQPILYTPTAPPVPIVYLQRIYGELDELAPEPPPIILKAETAITGGPQIGGYFVIHAELSVTIDTSGELIGRGDIFLISEDGRLAGAELGISVQRGLWIQGDINILDILIASGKVSLDLQN